MFSIVLRLKRKVKRLFKVQAESRQLRETSARSKFIKLSVPVIVTILIALLYPGESLVDPLDMPRRGEIALVNVIAPLKITISKSEREITNEQNLVRSSSPFIVEMDSLLTDQSFADLRSFTSLADSLRHSELILVNENMDSAASIVQVRFPTLSASAILWSLDSTVTLDSLRARIEKIYRRDIYRIGVLGSLSNLPRSPTGRVLLRRGNQEVLVSRDDLLDEVTAWARLLTSLNYLADTVVLDNNIYYPIGKSFLRPNLWINTPLYEERVSEAFAKITSVKKIVQKGDVIVRQGQEVSGNQEEVLREMTRLLRVQAAGDNFLSVFVPVLLRIVIIGFLFAALYLFLYNFRREVYDSNPKLFALILVFSIQLVLVNMAGVIGDEFGLNSPYLFPVAVLPIMVTILFDTQLGILTTVILALLLGIMHRFSFNVALLTMVVGTASCFVSRIVRKRTDFYRILFAVVTSYLGVILIVENLKLNVSDDILMEMFYGSIVGAASVLVTMFVLPIIESLFGFTTDITLLELSDLNHPLLKRLSIEAPGTYHHSMIVSNLCEAAAEAIGANALLARVGAYYHDIGKIETPEYFVENQLGIRSKHEDLTPSMSSLILAAHVKQGRTLGEEAEIPDAVLNFIEEHHGTMIMTYFHQKAIEQGESKENADKFRYPGPKPQIRETGISMLADAVEAASRTLDNPKPARIDSLIQRIINDRFQSGELDECPLTLRDLAGIKTAFAQVLNASFHHRIKYPKKVQPV